MNIKITKSCINGVKMKIKLKKMIKRFIGFFPQSLPHIGMKDFDAYCDMIFFTYDLPDLPSYRQAIASMIMHLSPTTSSASPFYFAKCVKKAMANQIAYEKIQLLKKEEAEYLAKTEYKSE